MKYFCAKCKCKHEITEIAVDLWDICRDDVKQQVNRILDNVSADDNQIDDLRPDLMSFLNDQARSGKSFLFKGSELDGRVENPVRQGDVLSGGFTLYFGWLLNQYRQDIQGTQAESALDACEPLLISTHYTPVYQSQMNFAFLRTGPQAERMFYKATDANGDPFTDEDGLQRGFLRCCPYCGGKLSPAVGRAPEIVIALSGAPRAGKTSCLTAIASALRHGKYRGFSMKPLPNDPLWDKLALEIDKYDKSIKVEKTPMEQSEVPAFSFLTRVGNSYFVLTFVDMPGEFWLSKNGLTKEFHEQYMGLYSNLDCIWLFISKLAVYVHALGKEGNRLPWQEQLIRDFSESSGVLSAADNLAVNLLSLKEHMGSLGQKLPPIAAIVTKSEADVNDSDDIRDRKMFPIGEDVTAMNIKELEAILPVSDGRFKLKERDYFGRAADVKSFLRKTNENLLRSIEENCDRKTYISMAAYGHPAMDPPARLEDLDRMEDYPPEPYHELLPLIWTMSIMGVLPIMHRCNWKKKNFFGSITDTTSGTQDYRFYYRRFEAVREKDQELQRALEDISGNLFMSTNRYLETDFITKK